MKLTARQFVAALLRAARRNQDRKPLRSVVLAFALGYLRGRFLP